MTDLEMVYKITTIGLNSCLQYSGDRVFNALLQHEKNKKLHSVVKESRRFKSPLNTAQKEIVINTKLTIAAKYIKKKAKNASLKDMKKRWRENPLHGKYPLRTDNAHVDILVKSDTIWLFLMQKTILCEKLSKLVKN